MEHVLTLVTDVIPTIEQSIRSNPDIEPTTVDPGPGSWLGVPSASDEPGF
jgi:hypothetical protein